LKHMQRVCRARCYACIALCTRVAYASSGKNDVRRTVFRYVRDPQNVILRQSDDDCFALLLLLLIVTVLGNLSSLCRVL